MIMNQELFGEESNSNFGVKMLNLYNNYIRNCESDENSLKLYNFYIKNIYKIETINYIRTCVWSKPTFYIISIYENRLIEDGFYIFIIYFSSSSSSSSRLYFIFYIFYIFKNYIRNHNLYNNYIRNCESDGGKLLWE